MERVIFALGLLGSLVVFAGEHKIVTISSNIDKDVTDFYLETLEDGSLDGMRFVTRDARGQVTQDNHATIEEVVDSGVVLFREGNREAVRLKVANFSAEAGGDVIVDYLYSGVTNSRKFLRLGIKKTDGDFFLHQAGKPVNTMKVFGNWSPILGLIGISEIRVMNVR